MTDRHAGYVVTLESDLREDDAAMLVAVISRLRGVVSVVPVLGDFTERVAEERVNEQWVARLRKLIADVQAPL